jgi:hypothetical protein
MLENMEYFTTAAVRTSLESYICICLTKVFLNIAGENVVETIVIKVTACK